MEGRPAYGDDDITLGDLVRRVQALWQEVWRHRRLPVVLALLGAAGMAINWMVYKPVYPATITFSVDEDEAGSGGGLTSLLGQFGLGSVRPTRYNLDKIMALSKSRRVMQEVFFRRVEADGRQDYLANILMQEYGLDEVNGKPFAFRHDSLAQFNREENDQLMSLYQLVIGPPEQPKKALVGADYDEDSNIMSLTATTTREMLSYELASGLFRALSDYYVNKAIEKQLNTYRIVSAKRDSVLTALKSAEYQLAGFKDRTHGLILRTDQVAELRLQREVAALSAMYVEVVKNTEVADFSLRNKTPFIQVIDSPVYPIRPVIPSLPRKIILGLLLGGMAGAMGIVLRKVLRDAMAA